MDDKARRPLSWLLTEWLRNNALLTAAISAGSLTAAACKSELPVSDRAGGPRLQRSQFIDGQRIELTFSKALAPVDAVDPQKFRLSLAFGYNGEFFDEDEMRALRYHASYYEDLGFSSCRALETERYANLGPYGEITYTDAYYSLYEKCEALGSTPELIDIASLELDDTDASKLVLTLTSSISDEELSRICGDYGSIVCEGTRTLMEANDRGESLEDCDVGTLVHFTSGGDPTITSTDGSALADIAEGFAIYEAIDDDPLYLLFYGIVIPDEDPARVVQCPDDIGR